MFEKFKKLFSFPPPTSFGADHDNFLECDFLRSSDDAYTWEDYYKDLKKTYPVKYFFLRAIPDFITYKIYYPVYRPIKEAFYWIQCHVVPSKRYHMLSLVQPKTKTDDDYSYGWVDSDRQILFACMNILVNFVEKERGLDELIKRIAWLREETAKYLASSEEDKKINYNVQEDYNVNLKILEIYNWWTKNRKQDLLEKEKALYSWTEDRKNGEKYQLFKQLEEKCKSDEDKMLKDLLKIRRWLWT